MIIITDYPVEGVKYYLDEKTIQAIFTNENNCLEIVQASIQRSNIKSEIYLNIPSLVNTRKKREFLFDESPHFIVWKCKNIKVESDEIWIDYASIC